MQDATISVLDALADALGTDTASLFMRDPRDPGGIWMILDLAYHGERRQIAEVAKPPLGYASQDKRRVTYVIFI